MCSRRRRATRPYVSAIDPGSISSSAPMTDDSVWVRFSAGREYNGLPVNSFTAPWQTAASPACTYGLLRMRWRFSPTVGRLVRRGRLRESPGPGDARRLGELDGDEFRAYDRQQTALGLVRQACCRRHHRTGPPGDVVVLWGTGFGPHTPRRRQVS